MRPDVQFLFSKNPLPFHRWYIKNGCVGEEKDGERAGGEIKIKNVTGTVTGRWFNCFDNHAGLV